MVQTGTATVGVVMPLIGIRDLVEESLLGMKAGKIMCLGIRHRKASYADARGS